MTSLRLFVFATLTTAFAFTGCSSAQKQREAQRKELAASSGLYCEFLSGDKYPDIDVALNVEMAKKCDSSKHYTITNFKNAAENYGIVYCCSLANNKKDDKKNDLKLDLKSEPKHEGKADVKTDAKPEVKPADSKGKAPAPNDKAKDSGDVLPE